MKDNFILYTLYYDAIMCLTDEQAGRLIKAIYRYVKTETEEEITDPSIAFAYTLIVTQIKESSRKYEEKCKRLRENASKGGLQKAANASNDLQEQANATEDSKSKQMVANGSKCKQNLADVSIRQDKTRQDKTTINKEDKDKKDELSICAEAQSSSSSDYSEVVEYWNAAVEKHGSAMRPLRGLTENRKAAIRARLREQRRGYPHRLSLSHERTGGHERARKIDFPVRYARRGALLRGRGRTPKTLLAGAGGR